jgi:hypothetical protein
VRGKIVLKAAAGGAAGAVQRTDLLVGRVRGGWIWQSFDRLKVFVVTRFKMAAIMVAMWTIVARFKMAAILVAMWTVVDG